MRWTTTIGWAGFAVLFVPFFASCSHSVEGFCEGWVEDTCQALTSCCTSGEAFDLEQCRLQLSETCQKQFEVEQVHAGEAVFDSGAARECSGEINACGDLAAAQKDTYAHRRACANAVTGFRPPGAACDASSQCAKAGDFATCYTGVHAGAQSGVCAKVVLAGDATCSFSFETNELHLCPDGTYCDIESMTPDPSLPPTKQVFEFSAPCKGLVAFGGKCFDAATNVVLPCADGLYCDMFGGGPDVCMNQVGAGEACDSTAQCAAGLICNYVPGKNTSTCAAGSSIPFCYAPAACGDGHCDANESSSSCPQDCGNGFCGDGVCGVGEKTTCPQDCAFGCVDKCGIAITEGGDVCTGTVSSTLFDNLISCAQASCATECPLFIMAHATPSADPDCGPCLQKSCGTDFTDCANDV